MHHRISSHLVLALATGLIVSACGGSPPTPPSPPGPGPAPTNALPSIASITVKGRRAGQPANFADVRETVDVVASVSDAETPIDELVYQWTATAGTFSGAGRNVTWTAPDTAATPGTVILTLKVIENYGHPGQPKNFSQDVSRTQTVALHDSVKEVGDMSRNFLIAFSTTSIKDWQVVMKDFNRNLCPHPGEVDDERRSVEDHYTNFTMHNYEIGPASVSVNFGGVCEYGLRGDACSSARVFWDSTGPTGRGTASGIDHLTAIYSAADTRWWLCSSRFQSDTTFGHGFYSR